MNENMETKDTVERYLRELAEFIEDTPELGFSSRTSDFVATEPYKKIISLGKPALPHIMEKLREGAFILNTAVLEIIGLDLLDVVPDPEGFYSEQEISGFLLEWWEQYHKKKG
jgi:hypothetical protein